MATENTVSITLSDEQKTQVRTALDTLNTTLKPFLVALTPENRMELPKMSDRSTPFVSKALDYAQSQPELAPAYLNTAELMKDVDAVTVLTEFSRTLGQLNENIDDTIMLAGSEAYSAAHTFYNSVKQATKMNVPGAKTTYDDLKKSFSR